MEGATMNTTNRARLAALSAAALAIVNAGNLIGWWSVPADQQAAATAAVGSLTSLAEVWRRTGRRPTSSAVERNVEAV